jgi:branched-chain amino acid transport system ATP-binding protein
VRFGGLVALDDVTFSVLPNEIVGLIGPNGAGKTTAFNVACGFVRATEGHVTIGDGRRAVSSRLSHVRNPFRPKPPQIQPHFLAGVGVARTLQGVGLFPNLSVLENVMAGAQSRKVSNFVYDVLGLWVAAQRDRKIRDEALGILNRLGIANFAAALPSAIPYGIAKKVSVARALMSHPTLLMLDEPASGLDERELEEFANLIRSLRQDMSVLLVEHNMDFVMPLVDRLVVLNFGKVIATGTPTEIGHDPAVLEAYLGVDE